MSSAENTELKHQLLLQRPIEIELRSRAGEVSKDIAFTSSACPLGAGASCVYWGGRTRAAELVNGLTQPVHVLFDEVPARVTLPASAASASWTFLMAAAPTVELCVSDFMEDGACARRRRALRSTCARVAHHLGFGFASLTSCLFFLRVFQ